MTHEQWEAEVSVEIKADALWKVRAYRLSLFLGDLAWQDVTKLMRDRRTIGIAEQVYRAVGSLGSDIAEGYSRSTGKDRARFYEYALVRRGKSGIGTTRLAMCWGQKWQCIALVS